MQDDDTKTLMAMVRELDRKTGLLVEGLSAVAELQQEMRARAWVAEAFSKGFYSVSVPKHIRDQVIAKTRENLRVVEVEKANPRFAELVHSAMQEMLEFLQDSPGESGAH